VSRLPEVTTIGQIKAFARAVEGEADGRVSRLNPALTKRQVWDILMAPFMERTDDAAAYGMSAETKATYSKQERRDSPTYHRLLAERVIVRNINKEFGSGKEVP
jgi:hypothetical protein